jgi:peptidoglycan hydrolase FlgJ
MSTLASLEPQISAATANMATRSTATASNAAQSASDRAHAKAVDFEASFLSSMFQEMFTDIGNQGPMSNGPGVGVWRSFLTSEFGKSFAKAGGVGIADHVYKSLMAHQEAHAG